MLLVVSNNAAAHALLPPFFLAFVSAALETPPPPWRRRDAEKMATVLLRVPTGWLRPPCPLWMLVVYGGCVLCASSKGVEGRG